MEKAIAQSMGQKYVEDAPSSGEDSDWENPKKKIKQFAGNAKSLSDEVNVNYQKFYIESDDV